MKLKTSRPENNCSKDDCSLQRFCYYDVIESDNGRDHPKDLFKEDCSCFEIAYEKGSPTIQEVN